MSPKEIFSLALNLQEPWYVKDVKFDLPEGKLHGQIDIYIDFQRGYKFKDKLGNATTAYDTEEKQWRHLNFFQHECYLHARVPRVKTQGLGINLVTVPWAREGSGFTLMFEGLSMLMLESEMPIKKAANLMNLKDTRLWRIFKYWVEKAIEKETYNEVVSIGIDETSTLKGHNYVTIAVDMDKRNVIFATKGKDSETVKDLKEHLELKGCSPEQIKQASIDMSPAYISGIMDNFPNAKITFDKFHIMKIINGYYTKI